MLFGGDKGRGEITPSRPPNFSTRAAQERTSSRQSPGETELPTQSISARSSVRATRHEAESESAETAVRTRQSRRALSTCNANAHQQFSTNQGSHDGGRLGGIVYLLWVEAHEGERGVEHPGSGGGGGGGAGLEGRREGGDGGGE